MSGLINNISRLVLSLSLMDRDLFVKKVSEILEVYKNDPEQMEKIASGLYQYMEEVKSRMDTKSMLTDVVDSAKLPSKHELDELSKAINNLANEMHKQNKNKGE